MASGSILLIIALLLGITIGLTVSCGLLPSLNDRMLRVSVIQLENVRDELMDIDLAYRTDTIKQRLQIQTVINRLEGN